MDVFLKILGIDGLQDEVRRLNKSVRTFITEWRNAMTTAKEQIEALTAKVDDLAADVRAGKSNLDPEAQAAFATLAEKVASLDAEVGDADGSDTPAPPADETAPVEGDGSFR